MVSSRSGDIMYLYRGAGIERGNFSRAPGACRLSRQLSLKFLTDECFGSDCVADTGKGCFYKILDDLIRDMKGTKQASGLMIG